MSDISDTPITPTMEDYLEAIFNISKEKRAIRVKDIASKLDVKMPTVTNMCSKLLAREGLLTMKNMNTLSSQKKVVMLGKK